MIIVQAKSYNQRGQAIIVYNHKPFYVYGLIRHEVAQVKIIKETATYGQMKIIKLLKTSPQRRKLHVAHQELIGGYELLHMQRQEQAYFKTKKVKDDFKAYAQTSLTIEPIFLGSKEFRYRNKITLHNGGFYQINSHKVIKLKDFLLSDIKPFTTLKGKVIFRQLDTLIQGSPGQNLYTTDTMLGLKFRVPLEAFYQINQEVAQVVYQKILSFIQPNQIIFDLYSGIGTIALLAAQQTKQVYGVEYNQHSFRASLINQKLNQSQNVIFYQMGVKDFLQSNQLQPDVVIVDPSRRGLKQEICQALIKLKPNIIIYLSCNPGTQASDYQRLKTHYQIIYAQPFDMFPQTYHIENLIVLKLIH